MYLKTEINHHHTFQLHTLTPLSIADGGVWSQLTDYILYKNDDVRQIKLINHAAFNKEFQADKTGGLIEKFVNLVRKSAGTNQTDILKDFIKSNFSSKLIKDYTHQYIPIQEWENGNATQIHTIIKQYLKPYIPGSSLKGAIKTAFLYDWLVSTAQGEQVVHNLRNTVRSQHHFDNFDVTAALFQEIGHISKKQERMDFSRFQVSDSPLLPVDSFNVYHTTRFHLQPHEKGREAMLQSLREAIQPAVNTTFTINIDLQSTTSNADYWQFWQKGEGFSSECFKKINEFSRANLKLELAAFQQLSSERKLRFDSFEHEIHSLLKVIKNHLATDNQQAIMRLGGGKTFMDNSIWAAYARFYPNDIHYMNNIRSKNQKSQKTLFPITRTLTSIQQTPLGWIQISQQPENTKK